MESTRKQTMTKQLKEIAKEIQQDNPAKILNAVQAHKDEVTLPLAVDALRLIHDRADQNFTPFIFLEFKKKLKEKSAVQIALLKHFHTRTKKALRLIVQETKLKKKAAAFALHHTDQPWMVFKELRQEFPRSKPVQISFIQKYVSEAKSIPQAANDAVKLIRPEVLSKDAATYLLTLLPPEAAKNIYQDSFPPLLKDSKKVQMALIQSCHLTLELVPNMIAAITQNSALRPDAAKAAVALLESDPQGQKISAKVKILPAVAAALNGEYNKLVGDLGQKEAHLGLPKGNEPIKKKRTGTPLAQGNDNG